MKLRHYPGWLVLCALAPALAAAEPRSREVAVDPRTAWTDTGLDVPAGSPLHLEASGTCCVVRPRLTDWLAGSSGERCVGPAGTYVWPRWYAASRGRRFPLPTMAEGPFPAFGLIGKLGADGAPFSVGARHDGIAPRGGRLWLGLNDDEPGDNRGRFRVTIELAARPPPAAPEPPVFEPGDSGAPVRGARVLLLYVDGLRPDVLQEMARAGFLPNVTRAFLDRGLWVANVFTVFPSNTLIANGSLFTGRWSDRTGIKSQNQFERSTLKPKGQLSAWLPDGFIPPPVSSHLRWLGFAGAASGGETGGGIIPRPATRVLNLLDKYAPENTHAFLVRRGVPTLGSRLGKAFLFTTLPIAPLNPPPQWFRRAVNTIGPFGVSTRLPRRLDEVNAQYAVEELIGAPDARVIAVWLPMVDKTGHTSARGQFGAARRELALADRWLGLILARLRQVGWERSTYLVLVSDHGHLGGEHGANAACNLPRDWAHRRLGLNVRVVGQEWLHPGEDPSRFVFFDNQGAGQAKLFLPRRSYASGPWRRNRLADLTHYELRPTQPAVNLLESLAAFHPPEWDGRGPKPVDLILVKLDERRVFLYRDEDRQAILHREGDGPQERYRYEPVRALVQSDGGELRYEPAAPGLDPLGYLQDAAFRKSAGGAGWLATTHTAREWLHATSQTRYPDAVVAMSKFFAWQHPVTDLADVRDPDLLVTASDGWSFRSDDGEGTDHGYPLERSMRITCAVSGPNIPRGTLLEPHRVIDVLPTILHMIGWPYDPADVDGEPIGGIYE